MTSNFETMNCSLIERNCNIISVSVWLEDTFNHDIKISGPARCEVDFHPLYHHFGPTRPGGGGEGVT